MRATAANASSGGIRPPSSYPSERATAPLDVATAAKPASSTRRADAASQAFGRTSGDPGTCSARSSSACFASLASMCARLQCARRPGDRGTRKRLEESPDTAGQDASARKAAKADGKWHRKETAGCVISGDAAGKGETVG